MSGYTKHHAKKGLDDKLPAIETWPNQFPAYEITIESPEFTSVCPKTGLPDFGLLVLRYTPGKSCLELKSYKEYLLAYRSVGIFYENAVNRVLRDVVAACKPEQASLTGVFNARGGMSASVVATYAKKGVRGMKGKITLGLESPIGRLDVTLSEDAVHRVDFGGMAPDGPVPRSVAPLFKRVKKELEEYFQGRRRSFDLPLDPDPPGTAFQNNVWAALREVPYGEVVSYGDLARWSGRPKAVRAVGGACGANRIPIIIPCHRVVAKEGLGGFGGGPKLKKQLLKLEKNSA